MPMPTRDETTMVLCCIDDLMFSSKVSTAARGLGIPLQFVRQASEILRLVRELKPSLVIFDLAAVRLRPLEAIAAIKADPALAGVRLVGYASHTDSSGLQSAHAAGAHEVLARSMFSERIADLLTRGTLSD